MKVTPDRSTRKFVPDAPLTAAESSPQNGSAAARSNSPYTRTPSFVVSRPHVLGMVVATVYTRACRSATAAAGARGDTPC
jgi:hypothetical protein